MATFIGTEKEFNDYIGPRVRNKIQTLTKKTKTKRGNVCQHCGKKVKELDAAHIHGRERKTIINELLQPYRSEDIYKVNLASFERSLMEAHQPVEKVFLFLCQECHVAYDSRPSTGEASSRAEQEASVLHDAENLQDVELSPLSQQPGESNRDFVQRVFAKLYVGGHLSDYELKMLGSDDQAARSYRKGTFNFTQPLFVTTDAERYDSKRWPRYYVQPTCGRFYLCSQWYRDRGLDNLPMFERWAQRMARS